jgi:hypothetical protein
MLGSFALGQQALGAFAEGGFAPDTSHIAPPTGAGGVPAWRKYGSEEWENRKRNAMLLALIRDSGDYKRLIRKLQMLQEHLLMAEGDRYRTAEVKRKIAAIEEQIRMMEQLD